MPYTVTFDDGTEVDFDSQPTMADIEEVAQTLNLQPKQPEPPGLLQRVQDLPERTTAPLRGFAKGVVDLPRKFASLGLKAGEFLADKAFGPSSSTSGAQTALREGVVRPEITKPKGAGERFGEGVEQLAEFFLPGVGQATKLPKAASLTQKALRVGEIALREGADVAAKTAVQTEGDAESIKQAGIIGAIAGPFSKAVGASAPAVSRYLEKVNLRLRPEQKTNLGKRLNEITDYLAKQKIVGTPAGRLEKAESLYEATENKLQRFLVSKAKNVRLSRKEIIDDLEAAKGLFKNDSDSLAIDRQIDGAIATLKAKQDRYISMADLNELKRSTYRNAYTKAGDKVRDDVEHAIGDIYRLKVEQGAASIGGKIEGKSLPEFNKEYGTLINARKLLKIASGRSELGLVGRSIASLVGAAATQSAGATPAIGAAAGLAAGGVIAGTPTRSLIGAMLESAGQKPTEETVKAMEKVLIQFLNESEAQ